MPVIPIINSDKSLHNNSKPLYTDTSSQYDSGFMSEYTSNPQDSLNQYRADSQGLIDSLSNGWLVNFPMKTGINMNKTLGFIGGALYGAVTDGKMMEHAVDNSYVNWMDEISASMEEKFPIYHDKNYDKLNALQKLGTEEFWSETAPDMAAFIAGTYMGNRMLGPIGLFSIPGKLIKGTAQLVGAEAALNAGIKTAGNSLTKIIGNNVLQKGTAGLLAESRILSATVFNSATEGLFEGQEVYKSTLEKTGDKKLAAEQASKSWWLNQLVLFPSSYFETSIFLGGGAKGINTALIDASENIVKPTFKQMATAAGKGAAKGILLEGVWEENIQLAIQKHNEDLTRANEGILEGIPNILKNYLDNFSTAEGQDNIVGGALMGLFMGGAGGALEINSEYKNTKKALENIDYTFSKLKEDLKKIEDQKDTKDLNKFTNTIQNPDGTTSVELNKFAILNKLKELNLNKEGLDLLNIIESAPNNQNFYDYIQNTLLGQTVASYSSTGLSDLLLRKLDDLKNISEADKAAFNIKEKKDENGNVISSDQQIEKAKKTVKEQIKLYDKISNIYYQKGYNVKDIFNKTVIRDELSSLLKETKIKTDKLSNEIVSTEYTTIQSKTIQDLLEKGNILEAAKELLIRKGLENTLEGKEYLKAYQDTKFIQKELEKAEKLLKTVTNPKENLNYYNNLNREDYLVDVMQRGRAFMADKINQENLAKQQEKLNKDAEELLDSHYSNNPSLITKVEDSVLNNKQYRYQGKNGVLTFDETKITYKDFQDIYSAFYEDRMDEETFIKYANKIGLTDDEIIELLIYKENENKVNINEVIDIENNKLFNIVKDQLRIQSELFDLEKTALGLEENVDKLKESLRTSKRNDKNKIKKQYKAIVNLLANINSKIEILKKQQEEVDRLRELQDEKIEGLEKIFNKIDINTSEYFEKLTEYKKSLEESIRETKTLKNKTNSLLQTLQKAVKPLIKILSNLTSKLEVFEKRKVKITYTTTELAAAIEKGVNLDNYTETIGTINNLVDEFDENFERLEVYESEIERLKDQVNKIREELKEYQKQLKIVNELLQIIKPNQINPIKNSIRKRIAAKIEEKGMVQFVTPGQEPIDIQEDINPELLEPVTETFGFVDEEPVSDKKEKKREQKKTESKNKVDLEKDIEGEEQIESTEKKESISNFDEFDSKKLTIFSTTVNEENENEQEENILYNKQISNLKQGFNSIKYQLRFIAPKYANEADNLLLRGFKELDNTKAKNVFDTLYAVVTDNNGNTILTDNEGNIGKGDKAIIVSIHRPDHVEEIAPNMMLIEYLYKKTGRYGNLVEFKEASDDVLIKDLLPELPENSDFGNLTKETVLEEAKNYYKNQIEDTRKEVIKLIKKGDIPYVKINNISKGFFQTGTKSISVFNTKGETKAINSLSDVNKIIVPISVGGEKVVKENDKNENTYVLTPGSVYIESKKLGIIPATPTTLSEQDAEIVIKLLVLSQSNNEVLVNNVPTNIIFNSESTITELPLINHFIKFGGTPKEFQKGFYTAIRGDKLLIGREQVSIENLKDKSSEDYKKAFTFFRTIKYYSVSTKLLNEKGDYYKPSFDKDDNIVFDKKAANENLSGYSRYLLETNKLTTELLDEDSTQVINRYFVYNPGVLYRSSKNSKNQEKKTKKLNKNRTKELSREQKQTLERDLKDLEDFLKVANLSPKKIEEEKNTLIANFYNKLFPETKEEEIEETSTETPEAGNVGVVEDAEYNDFIDKGKVSEARLNDIANKVKNQEPLSDREKEIFSDKTGEINKIIATQAGSVGVGGDVNIIDSKSDDIIAELNKLKTPQEKLNWLKEKGLITSIVINGKNYNSIDYSDRIMVLAKIGKYNIPFYISTGQAGKKNVKAGNWYAIFGIGESGWINKGSEELINKQYDFPIFQKIAKILNEGVGKFESRENNGNGKIIEGIGYLEDSKNSISDFNAQMGLPITPAKNNTDSKTFYENVNTVLNLVNDELKNVTQSFKETPQQSEVLSDAKALERRKSILLKKANLSKAPEFAQKAIAKTVEAIDEEVRLQVIEKAYNGITATPISNELGLTTEQVRSIRTYYGVPDVVDKTDYQNWKKGIDAELKALEDNTEKIVEEENIKEETENENFDYLSFDAVTNEQNKNEDREIEDSDFEDYENNKISIFDLYNKNKQFFENRGIFEIKQIEEVLLVIKNSNKSVENKLKDYKDQIGCLKLI